jgi:toxin YoeB
MEVGFSGEAQEDLRYWKKLGDVAVMRRIELLVDAIRENPYQGIGKPEALKYELAGYWSRRINREHRIVYSVEEETVFVYSLRGHYV